jgi:hypothetical protein
MQVCLIGDFSPNLDEGYKNVSHYLADELGTRLEIKRLDVKRWFLENSKIASPSNRPPDCSANPV